MNIEQVKAADLPEMDEAVKTCVNQGYWFLFKLMPPSTAPSPSMKATLEAPDKAMAFGLKTGTGVVWLNARGGVVGEARDPAVRVGMETLVYFEDLPHPPSLSSAGLPAAGLFSLGPTLLQNLEQALGLARRAPTFEGMVGPSGDRSG